MATLAPLGAAALAKRVLRYLVATSDLGINYFGGKEAEDEKKLTCYCDASFAPHGTISYTGLCLMWLGSPLLWRAVKQQMVSQSTAEAELQAMAAGQQLTMAVREILGELGVEVSPEILGDNQAAISLAKNGGTWRSRHFAVKASALRQAFRLGWATVGFVSSEHQLADMMTKLLGAAISRRLREAIGMGAAVDFFGTGV